MTGGPLEGVRVLDFALAMAGPLTAQKLGDLGAEVIKIEPPTGEWQRTRAAGDAWVNEMNASFISLNRNKRSIALDLKAEAGKEIALKLAATADVAIFNFRAGVAERLGVGYEAFRAVNDRIVYCSLTGYGPVGHLASRPGQDLIIQGYSGLMWNGGTQDSTPTPAPLFVVDATAANVAAQGILAALVARERTSKGQRLDVSMLDAMIDLQIQEFTVFLTTGVLGDRTEEPIAHRLIPGPYGVFKTADGYMTVAFGPLDVLGEALGDDRLSAFTTWSESMQHRDEIYRIVADALPAKTTAEWIEIFDHHGFWAGPVLNYEELAAEPQIVDNGMIVEIEHETEGTLRLVGPPLKFSETPASIRVGPPRIGEHSSEILAEIGVGEAQISELLRAGVVVEEPLASETVA